MIPPEARAAKINAFATVMANRFLSARQKLAIQEPLLDGEIPAVLDNSYGAHAHRALCMTLQLDLMRDIWAFTLDFDERSPSLRNTWRLIQDDQARSALRAVATAP